MDIISIKDRNVIREFKKQIDFQSIDDNSCTKLTKDILNLLLPPVKSHQRFSKLFAQLFFKNF